jgi:hypothetical protein
MGVSKHAQILEVQALYDKVITIIRTRYSAPDVERWFKAVNDEIADSKARNNQNALKCPIISWSDVTSGGKPKDKILCAIVAMRSLLEEKKLQLRYDVWKSYSVITDEKGVEQYQSRQTDSILREWRNYIYERKATMYSMDVAKDAYHQIAKDNEFHSLQEKIRAVKWDGVDRFVSGAQAFGLKLTGEGEDINFTVRAFKQHLMASMARVFYPGVWYDLVLCTLARKELERPRGFASYMDGTTSSAATSLSSIPKSNQKRRAMVSLPLKMRIPLVTLERLISTGSRLMFRPIVGLAETLMGEWKMCGAF